MSIEELITKYPTKSARQIAQLALDDADLVLGIVTREVERIRRTDTRNIELNRIGPLIRSYSTDRSVATTEMLSALNAAFKPTRGADFISWGKATREQHVQRIEFLQAHIAGCQATIHRHEAAIAAIDAAGVTCLDELATESGDAAA